MQKQGFLWWVATQKGQPGPIHQLIIPQLHRNEVLSQAHGHPWSGHQSHNKTLEQLLTRFFWSCIYEDTQAFCRSCKEYQHGVKPTPGKGTIVSHATYRNPI